MARIERRRRKGNPPPKVRATLFVILEGVSIYTVLISLLERTRKKENQWSSQKGTSNTTTCKEVTICIDYRVINPLSGQILNQMELRQCHVMRLIVSIYPTGT